MWQSRPNEATRWQPRWTRLLGDAATGEEGAASGGKLWEELPTPSDSRRLGDREKRLAGAAGAAVAAVVVAVLLWQATGTLIGAVFGPKAERAVAVPAVAATATRPAVVAAAVPVPTATRGAATITIVPAVQTPVAISPTTAVPGGPTTAATTAATTALTMAPTTGPTTAPTAVPTTVRLVHTVERGDTLFSIARRNGTTVSALVAANGLASPETVLSVGRRIVVPQ